jgi:hypothetical protein
MAIANQQADNLKKRLLAQQKAAANFERSGKKIPAKTIKKLGTAQTHYQKKQAEISAYEQQKMLLKSQLVQDKARFTTLKNFGAHTPTIEESSITSLMLGEVSCDQEIVS